MCIRDSIQIGLLHFVQDFFYFCPFLRSGQITLLFALCFLFQILIPFLLIFYFLYLLQTYDQTVLDVYKRQPLISSI